MQRFKQNLLIAAAFTVLGITGLFMNARQAVAQNPNAGSAPVTIVAPVPLPVTDVDNAARTPFQEFLRSDVAAGGSFAVAFNQSLTIEFVTSDCVKQHTAPQTNSGTDFGLITTTATKTVRHFFHPRFSRVFAQGTLFDSHYGSTDMSRIYADPGTTVSLAGIQSDFTCFVTVSGYTVPA